MLDWQTEEDQTWNEQPQPQTAVSPWPRRFLWLLLVLLLGGGGWYAAGFLQERIETATGETEADLRQAYGLLRQTAQRQDTDLFNLLLSGRDESWAGAQERLVRDGQLLDRPTWGLTHQPELVTGDPVTEVILSPDLLAAEVTAVEPYQFWSIIDQQVKTIRLQHSAVYRLGPDRWLYAPPEPDFWGETLEVRSDTLHLSYPERDHEIVEQLFSNLSALMANTCRLPGFYCHAFRVEFVTDPATLGQSLSQAIISPDEPILLPTPTLMGVPRNAEGYEFLWLAYGRYLSSAIITRQSDYTCCQHVQIYEALLHYQLAELGLFDWPLVETALEPQLIQSSLHQQDQLNIIWGNTAPHGWLPFLDMDSLESEPIPDNSQIAYILADYLLRGHDQTAATLQNALIGFDALLDWHNAVSPIAAQTEEQLLLLLADHVSSQDTDQPQPTGLLTITCTPNNSAVRISYDPLSRTWQEHVLPPLPAALIEAGRQPPIIQEVIPTDHTDFYLLRSSDTTYLATTDWLYPIEWGGGLPFNFGFGTLQVTTTPDGRLLNLTWKRLLRSQQFTYYYLLDRDICDETGCLAERIPGEVHWSPNGRYSLISVSEGQSETPGLYLGDAEANIQVYLADHFDRLTPIWLDDAHFAYPFLTDEDTVQFAIHALAGSQSAGDNQPFGDSTTASRQLLTIESNQLTNMLPDERDPLRPVQPIQLTVSQDGPDRLLLVAAKPWVRDQIGSGVSYEQYYLFWLQLTADLTDIETIPLPPLSSGAPLLGQINSEGSRAIVYTPLSAMNQIVMMFDRPTYAPSPAYITWPFTSATAAPAPTWSADGNWLAITYPFGLLLTNPPAFDLVHLAPYDLSNCIHSQWSQ
ncbi:MAG: hypothetical protein R6X32_21155 [Chloroflexota bacterium]